MEETKYCAPFSCKEPEVLDVKPLRTLAPMFPALLGSNISSPPSARPFVFVTPYGTYAAPDEVRFPSNFCSLFPTTFPSKGTNERLGESSPGKKSNGNLCDGECDKTNDSFHGSGLSASPRLQTSPVAMVLLDDDDDDDDPLLNGSTPTSNMQIEQAVPLRSLPMCGSVVEENCLKKPKRKRPRKAQDSEQLLITCSSYGARESVEVVLMTFDALRRRLLQLDDMKNVNRSLIPKAGTVMMDNDLRANKVKRIGHVPGIEVGDLFYLRIEMCLVGLHAQSVGGIDYMTAKFGDEEDPVAVAVVSAGGYENEDGDADFLVYSGQGDSAKDNQKLERGNLALERSLLRSNEVRVIRTVKDVRGPNGSKIYVYDGLYKINKSWVETAKSGFNVFKYKLIREPGQPDGIAVWKMIEKWRADSSSRGKLILLDLSSGVETLPVCLVNDVDEAKGPDPFTYVTTLQYPSSLSPKPRGGCLCQIVCVPDDKNCTCLQPNSGELPYTSNGLLVSHKPLIYECGASCQCSVHCRNRLTQKGITHRFEVFRTKDCGWGLRCWDPIRAGAFICEYAGEVIEKLKVDEDDENEYVFQAMHTDQRALNWNYIPELLGEPSHPDSVQTLKPLEITMSAKNMGNISRFMNHSCSPNAFWQPVLHDHGDEGNPHIMFFAIRHIPPMTELTYDYGLGRAEVGTEEVESGNLSRRLKKCLCGSPKCRGVF